MADPKKFVDEPGVTRIRNYATELVRTNRFDGSYDAATNTAKAVVPEINNLHDPMGKIFIVSWDDDYQFNAGGTLLELATDDGVLVVLGGMYLMDGSVLRYVTKGTDTIFIYMTVDGNPNFYALEHSVQKDISNDYFSISNNSTPFVGTTMMAVTIPGNYCVTPEQSLEITDWPEEFKGMGGTFKVYNTRGINTGLQRHLAQIVIPDVYDAGVHWNLVGRQVSWEVGSIDPPQWSEWYTAFGSGGDYLKLKSDTTQVIDSDISLGPNVDNDHGHALFGVDKVGSHHNIAKLATYDEGSQVEIGSESTPLCLNHEAIEGWSTRNITVNGHEADGTEFVEQLAYVRDIMTGGLFVETSTRTGYYHIVDMPESWNTTEIGGVAGVYGRIMSLWPKVELQADPTTQLIYVQLDCVQASCPLYDIGGEPITSVPAYTQLTGYFRYRSPEIRFVVLQLSSGESSKPAITGQSISYGAPHFSFTDNAWSGTFPAYPRLWIDGVPRTAAEATEILGVPVRCTVALLGTRWDGGAVFPTITTKTSDNYVSYDLNRINSLHLPADYRNLYCSTRWYVDDVALDNVYVYPIQNDGAPGVSAWKKASFSSSPTIPGATWGGLWFRRTENECLIKIKITLNPIPGDPEVVAKKTAGLTTLPTPIATPYDVLDRTYLGSAISCDPGTSNPLPYPVVNAYMSLDSQNISFSFVATAGPKQDLYFDFVYPTYAVGP